MNFNQEENDANEIARLTINLHKIIDSAVSENYFGVQELEIIQNQMNDLIKQGIFWIEQNNSKRFIYDLKNFTLWLCEYCEQITGEKWDNNAGG